MKSATSFVPNRLERRYWRPAKVPHYIVVFANPDDQTIPILAVILTSTTQTT
jgi:hypothetical protein